MDTGQRRALMARLSARERLKRRRPGTQQSSDSAEVGGSPGSGMHDKTLLGPSVKQQQHINRKQLPAFEAKLLRGIRSGAASPSTSPEPSPPASPTKKSISRPQMQDERVDQIRIAGRRGFSSISDVRVPAPSSGSDRAVSGEFTREVDADDEVWRINNASPRDEIGGFEVLDTSSPLGVRVTVSGEMELAERSTLRAATPAEAELLADQSLRATTPTLPGRSHSSALGRKQLLRSLLSDTTPLSSPVWEAKRTLGDMALPDAPLSPVHGDRAAALERLAGAVEDAMAALVDAAEDCNIESLVEEIDGDTHGPVLPAPRDAKTILEVIEQSIDGAMQRIRAS